MRENGYNVGVSGSPVVTTTPASFNAVNEVTSLYGVSGTVWTWPSLPSTYTRCWTVRNSVNIDWLVACFANTSPFTYVVDQQTMDVPTTAPIPVDTASANYMHSSYTWNRALSIADMKLVTMAMRKEIGGNPHLELVAVAPIRDLRAYYLRFLLALRPPQSIHIFADMIGTGGVNSIVPDRVDGRFNATVTSGTVRLVSTTGWSNGANNAITVLRGDMNSGILWPERSIPATRTICSVSRYTAATGQNFIFTSAGSPTTSSDMIHGHWNEKRGMVKGSGTWMTQVD